MLLSGGLPGGRERAFVIGGSGGVARLSRNGVNWSTLSNLGIGGSYLQDVQHMGARGRLVVICGDGKNTRGPAIRGAFAANTALPESPFNLAADGKGRITVAGNAGGPCRLRTSTDGISWSACDIGGDIGSFSDIAYSAELGQWISMSSSLTIFRSSNGTAFTGTAVGSAWLRGAAWSPQLGLWCVVGNIGQIYTSTDGQSWTARTSGTSDHLRKVAWNPVLGMFLAVGATSSSGGRLARSTDGISWTLATLGSAPLWNVAVADSGRFVVVGDGGAVYYSDNGTSWSSASIGSSADLRCCHFGDV